MKTSIHPLKPFPSDATPSEKLDALRSIQEHSSTFRHTNLQTLDPAVVDNIGRAIQREAADTMANSGQLHEVKYTDPAGRTISEYYGDIGKAFGPFMTGKTICKLNTSLKSQTGGGS